MKCQNCPHKEEAGAIEQLETNVSWHCNMKHTDCEDVVCLLRMLIWTVADLVVEDEDTDT